MENTTKTEALALRKSGKSYNVISKKLAVAKGTLSYWFKDIRESELIKKKNIAKAKNQWANNLIKYNKERSTLARKRWTMLQDENRASIHKINDKELMLIGIALYWAEGYKRGNWNVIFCNADPEMNRVMIKFFTKICKVPVDKIKVQIQLHNNVSPSQAERYWTHALKLKRSQFLKTVFYELN